MSSRRGAGEENILAMLERDSARRTGPRMSGVRLASYGAAAALAGILVGGVAWLAWDNHQGVQELQAQHEAVNEANATVPPVMPDAVLPPQAPPAVAAANPVDVPHAAVIVDESARKRDTVVASAPASTVPPLVMLPPHELNGSKPAPTATRAAQDTAPAKVAKSEPPPAPAVVQKQLPAQAPVQKQALAQAPKQAKVQAKSSPEKKADKAQKPASRPTKPAAAPARGKAATKVAAKGKPEAPRSRKAAPNAEPAVDSDVALISAIIQHAERHRGERAVATPPAAAPAKPPRR